MSTGVFSSNGWYNIGLIPGLSIMQILQSIRPDISSNTSQIRIYVANVGTAPPDASNNTFTKGLDVSRGDIPDTIIDASDRLFFPSILNTTSQFTNFFLNNLRAPTGFFNKNLSFNGRSIDLCGNFEQPDDAETFAGADWVEIPHKFWDTTLPTFSSSSNELSTNTITINGINNGNPMLPIAIGAWIYIDNSNTSLDITANFDNVAASAVLLANASFKVYKLKIYDNDKSLLETFVSDSNPSIKTITTNSSGIFNRSELINLFNDDEESILLQYEKTNDTVIVGTNDGKPPPLNINILIPGPNYVSSVNITNLQNILSTKVLLKKIDGYDDLIDRYNSELNALLDKLGLSENTNLNDRLALVNNTLVNNNNPPFQIIRAHSVLSTILFTTEISNNQFDTLFNNMSHIVEPSLNTFFANISSNSSISIGVSNEDAINNLNDSLTTIQVNYNNTGPRNKTIMVGTLNSLRSSVFNNIEGNTDTNSVKIQNLFGNIQTQNNTFLNSVTESVIAVTNILPVFEDNTNTQIIESIMINPQTMNIISQTAEISANNISSVSLTGNSATDISATITSSTNSPVNVNIIQPNANNVENNGDSIITDISGGGLITPSDTLPLVIPGLKPSLPNIGAIVPDENGERGDDTTTSGDPEPEPEPEPEPPGGDALVEVRTNGSKLQIKFNEVIQNDSGSNHPHLKAYDIEFATAITTPLTDSLGWSALPLGNRVTSASTFTIPSYNYESEVGVYFDLVDLGTSSPPAITSVNTIGVAIINGAFTLQHNVPSSDITIAASI